MPWEGLEETYAPKFSHTTGDPATCTACIWWTVHQTAGWLNRREVRRSDTRKAYMQLILGFDGYYSKASFYPSMNAHFRMRFSEVDLIRINLFIAERGKALMLEAVG